MFFFIKFINMKYLILGEMLFWIVMVVVNCMNGLGERLLGGDKVGWFDWRGNFKLLVRFRCLGIIDLFLG